MADKTNKPPKLKRGLNVPDAAHYCGVSANYLNQLRSKGQINGIQGPCFLKIGDKKVIYTLESLDAWLDSFVEAQSLAEMSQIKQSMR
ncbi:helix-turn-helix transcriptional regulator [Endozoicomonas arenosclerae]|uniref:helix-turn-helix transcriptional regulator n=1 Tax=Endozoicomonas arenosclerae TaxID=1633495 RepID=UPI0007826C8A|nr:helix-turn-helix domain-containing protein [Endozoicomonas arenosclerae]